MQGHEITTGALAKLLDITPKTIADLGKREIIVKGKKRGTWQCDIAGRPCRSQGGANTRRACRGE